MKSFDFYHPTEIRFGRGRLGETGAVAAARGDRCLLVTEPPCAALKPVFEKTRKSLKAAGVAVKHFTGVQPPGITCSSKNSRVIRPSRSSLFPPPAEPARR